MSRILASGLLVVCLLLVGCTRPGYQSVECDCSTPRSSTTIEFRAAQDSAAPGYTAMTLSRHGMSETVFVSDTVGLTMGDVATVNAVRLDAGKPMLSLALTAEGAIRMRALSQAQMGQRLAFLVDGRLVQAGTVVSEIGETAMVTGSLTEDECCAVSCALRAARGNRAQGT